VADLPWAGVRTRLHLNVRRFFCDNRDCTRTVFAERLGAALPASARRTTRLVEALRNIAFTGGGESGARLAHAQGMPASPRPLLRLLQAHLVPQLPPSRVVGIDEWAWKKGRTYGTILVDLEQKRPVDLLPDREVKSVASWFRAHPEVEIIARDRSGLYAEVWIPKRVCRVFQEVLQ
jgi:transposase